MMSSGTAISDFFRIFDSSLSLVDARRLISPVNVFGPLDGLGIADHPQISQGSRQVGVTKDYLADDFNGCAGPGVHRWQNIAADREALSWR